MRNFNRMTAIWLVALTGLVLIFAYFTKTYETVNFKNGYTAVIANEEYSSKPYLSLNKLPRKYNYDLAVEQGDVVNRLGKVVNLEKLDKFIKDYESKALKNNEIIRITYYSVTGTPVIYDLVSTTDGLRVIVDPTRVSRKLKVEEYKVSSISIDTRGENTTYMIKTDSNKEISLISITRNVE